MTAMPEGGWSICSKLAARRVLLGACLHACLLAVSSPLSATAIAEPIILPGSTSVWRHSVVGRGGKTDCMVWRQCWNAALRGGHVEATTACADQAREHRDEGDRLFKSARYQDAIKAYTAALVADCSVDGAFGGRAACLLMTSQYGAALHDAVRAVHEADTRDTMGTSVADHQRRRVSGAVSSASDRTYVHLLMAKTLLAMGRAEEASLQYKQVAELCESRSGAISRRVAHDFAQEAREGIKHARTFEAIIRKSFTNLHQTRDLFYIPIVGRWRSWRKTSSVSDALDLPLGTNSLPLGFLSSPHVICTAH